MDRYSTSVLLEFSDACPETRSSAEVAALVERVTSAFGVERFAMTGLPLPHEELASYFLLNGWPQGWLERYLQRNYFRRDPVVEFTRRHHRITSWSEIDNRSLPSKARQVMCDAADFGLLEGLTIPIYSPVGLAGLFSVAGRRISITSHERDLLRIVAITAHARLTSLERLQNSGTFIAVTRSESECLTWCTLGKTDREIGALTCRSPRTVQQHLSNLQRKFGVSNRAQLIAEAFRRGLQR